MQQAVFHVLHFTSLNTILCGCCPVSHTNTSSTNTTHMIKKPTFFAPLQMRMALPSLVAPSLQDLNHHSPPIKSHQVTPFRHGFHFAWQRWRCWWCRCRWWRRLPGTHRSLVIGVFLGAEDLHVIQTEVPWEVHMRSHGWTPHKIHVGKTRIPKTGNHLCVTCAWLVFGKTLILYTFEFMDFWCTWPSYPGCVDHISRRISRMKS